MALRRIGLALLFAPRIVFDVVRHLDVGLRHLHERPTVHVLGSYFVGLFPGYFVFVVEDVVDLPLRKLGVGVLVVEVLGP